MKQLFLKEWRELRFLPLGAAILCFLLEIGYLAICKLILGGAQPGEYSWDIPKAIVWEIWAFFAILAGAGLVSQENGNGTLPFLFSLPTGRGRIWVCKVAAAFFIVLLCMVSSTIAAAIVTIARSISMTGHLPDSYLLGYYLSGWDGAILCAAGCFAVSIAISPLFDRYFSAVAVSTIVCLIFAMIIPVLPPNYDHVRGIGPEWLSVNLSYAILWLAIPVFMANSYWTFTRGETLRSLKRFYAAGRAGIIGLVVFLALFSLVRSHAQAQVVEAEAMSKMGVGMFIGVPIPQTLPGRIAPKILRPSLHKPVSPGATGPASPK